MTPEEAVAIYTTTVHWLESRKFSAHPLPAAVLQARHQAAHPGARLSLPASSVPDGRLSLLWKSEVVPCKHHPCAALDS